MDHRPNYPAPLRWIGHAIDTCLAVGGLAIVLLVFINATLRGTAGFDLSWSLEVTAFLLLWLTFLGCAAAMARGAHMRVTEIVSALVPATPRRWLMLLIDVGIIMVLLSLVYQGWSIADRTWHQKTTVLYWPVGLLYASMPVGMALTLVFHVWNTWLDFLNRPDSGPELQKGSV